MVLLGISFKVSIFVTIFSIKCSHLQGQSSLGPQSQDLSSRCGWSHHLHLWRCPKAQRWEDRGDGSSPRPPRLAGHSHLSNQNSAVVFMINFVHDENHHPSVGGFKLRPQIIWPSSNHPPNDRCSSHVKPGFAQGYTAAGLLGLL